MNELMVSLQGRGGNTDEDILLSCSKNYSWQTHVGWDGRLHDLGSKIGHKPPQKYHWKVNIKGFQLV
jgi:hypothetical protein